MKTLLIEMDDEFVESYQNFSPEHKKQLAVNIGHMIKKTAGSARAARLKKLIEELKDEMPENEINRELLIEFLRPED